MSVSSVWREAIDAYSQFDQHTERIETFALLVVTFVGTYFPSPVCLSVSDETPF
jgi:hypothetical protein